MAINEMVGIIISAAIAIGSFVALVLKVIKPINDLNISIVKLTAAIESLLANDKRQDDRINKHGTEIDSINMQIVNHEQRIKNLERR